MLFENVSILSVDREDPPHRITSAWIMEQLAPTTDRLGIPAGLLEGLTGIVARKWWDEGAQPSGVATLAAEKAIAAAGIERRQLGALISTSVCRDYIEPSTACLVHGNLELAPDCLNFDISNACLAFISGMDQAGMMIERGEIDYAIVVDGESSRYPIEQTIERLLEPDTDEAKFRDNFATLTLGSGAVAMVLCRADAHPEAHRYFGGVSLAATEHNRLCLGQPDRMVTDTKPLLIEGLKLAARTWARSQEVMNWGPTDLDLVVMHQVSKTHTEQWTGLSGVDPAKVHTIYAEYGNIGPAGIPVVLSQAVEQGKVERGGTVALMGIGSGLNSTMAKVVW